MEINGMGKRRKSDFTKDWEACCLLCRTCAIIWTIKRKRLYIINNIRKTKNTRKQKSKNEVKRKRRKYNRIFRKNV